jgi:hypothetical protein
MIMSSGSVDIHRFDVRFDSTGSGRGGFPNLPAAMVRGQCNIPTTVFPSQLYVRIHGFDLWQL